MAGSWRTPRGPIAFVGVMGLVLLSLMLTGATGSASGGPAFPQGSSSGPVWSLGGWDPDLSSLPSQVGGAREHHVLSLWPPLRGERQAEPGHLALLPSPDADADAVRDPQQLAHRTAGSRSPPLL